MQTITIDDFEFDDILDSLCDEEGLLPNTDYKTLENLFCEFYGTTIEHHVFKQTLIFHNDLLYTAFILKYSDRITKHENPEDENYF